MSRTFPKSVTESKPVQAVAGAGDLAAEKIRDLSHKAADKFASIEADPTAASNRIQADLERNAEVLGTRLRSTSAEVRSQLEGLSVKAQEALHAAFQQASETYDALAERGKEVVVRFGGEAGYQIEATETKPQETEPAPKPRKSAPRKQTATHTSKASSKPSTTTRKTARTTKKSGS